MNQRLLTDTEIRRTVEALRKTDGNVTEAAKLLGLARQTVQNRKIIIEQGRYTVTKEPEFEAAPIADSDMSVEELVEWRKRQYERKKQAEEKNRLIDVKVKIGGPIGILWFGDPHVDDDGTDLAMIESHARLVRETEGLFGANIGDTTNNWVGRLARLYAEQSTTAAQAWKLAEWFIKQVDWLLVIDGNHDVWSGAGNPIAWMTRGISGIHKPNGARIRLQFPNKTDIRIHARHEFAGGSIYNPTHGVMKAVHFGVRDHLSVCGHKHVSGYGVLKDPETMRTCHAVQIASYKVFDRYADEKGFRNQALSPCALTVIEPAKPDDHPDKIKVFWEPEEGAQYLSYLRGKK